MYRNEFNLGYEAMLRRIFAMRMKLCGMFLIISLLALVTVVSAGLPTTAGGRITDGSTSYWDLTFSSTNPVPSDIQYNRMYPGWSLDSVSDISPDAATFQVYSSLGPLPATLPAIEWNKINYMLNNKGTYNKYALQAAIWHYSGTEIPSGFPSFDQKECDKIIAAADLHGEHFVPTTGQKYAVILYAPVTSSKDLKGTYQLIVAELPFPSIPAPEFPSLALPVGMVLGIAGSVYFIKGRKE
jgi:hypothetical protein